MTLQRLFPACVTAVFAIPLVLASSAAAADQPVPATAAAVDLAVLVYDPRDALALPGDTHALTVASFGEYRQVEIPGQDLRATLRSYDCGPHEPSVPPRELPCALAGSDLEGVDVTGSRLDVTAAGVVRVRGLVAGRRLDLTVTGTGGSPAFVHTWRHAEGTSRSSGRTVASEYPATAVTGTFGAVPVAANAVTPPWLRTYSTTVRAGSGPALPLPALPQVGTEQDGWTTVAVASAAWRRSLPRTGPAGSIDLETGRVTARAGGGDQAGVSADVTHRRCAGAGGCQVLATSSGGESRLVRFGLVEGTAHVRHLVSMVSDGDAAGSLLLDLDWQGGRPAGFHELDVVSGEGQPEWRQERSGVRWNGPVVSGTVDGSPIGPVTGAALSAYRERIVQAD
jgi:hypothetical protein